MWYQLPFSFSTSVITRYKHHPLETRVGLTNSLSPAGEFSEHETRGKYSSLIHTKQSSNINTIPMFLGEETSAESLRGLSTLTQSGVLRQEQLISAVM